MFSLQLLLCLLAFLFSLDTLKALWSDAADDKIPVDPTGPFYPYANATEALLLIWYITTQPTQKTYRQLLWLLRHADFNLNDLPEETKFIKLPERLPLLPGYSIKDGKTISFIYISFTYQYVSLFSVWK